MFSTLQIVETVFDYFELSFDHINRFSVFGENIILTGECLCHVVYVGLDNGHKFYLKFTRDYFFVTCVRIIIIVFWLA